MKNNEITPVFSAGLIQGITLVAFPAASTVFTNPEAFNLSPTAYGSLFIPQAILSIIASALTTKLTRLWGAKSLFLLGLFANLCSMILLSLSAALMHHTSVVYCLLLLATASLGIGFGLTIPTLNTMTERLRPKQLDSAILTLNALLGVGTALAPVLIAIFIGLGYWWGLPLLLALTTCLLIFLSIPLALPDKVAPPADSLQFPISSQFWIFATFALIYGIVETLNGNWVSIYMKTFQNATSNIQSLALTAFWGLVTLGRVLFAWTEKWIHARTVYQFLPFVLAVAFILISNLTPNHDCLSICAFGLAGLGCSALLPLTISFGTSAGGIIAFYLTGYGIAAFGAGPLQDAAMLNLKDIYAIGTVLAILLGIISWTINKKHAALQKEKV